MAIDSSLWVADIPVGEYHIGDIVPLECVDGPANVRSGRGAAVLKSFFTATLRVGSGTAYWRVHIKNSDWVDEVISLTAAMEWPTSFDPESGLQQIGHDCNLTPNSGWEVYAECITDITTTGADSIFALIDVDYPQVSAVTNPRLSEGTPTSIENDVTVSVNAFGSAKTAGWNAKSYDYFKAGYRYVLACVEMMASAETVGFIAFANAAGMGGLQRILPISSHPESIRSPVKYSSVLVKGPMEIKYKVFQSSAGTANLFVTHDYVKRS